MVHGIPNNSVPAINYATTQGGKMSLFVNSTSLIYSHFEHVNGIPAPKGTEGVTVSKLNLLDVLIGQLDQVKRGANSQPVIPADLQGMTDKHLDTLIEKFENQIRQAKAASMAMPYIPSPSAQSGAVFSLVV